MGISFFADFARFVHIAAKAVRVFPDCEDWGRAVIAVTQIRYGTIPIQGIRFRQSDCTFEVGTLALPTGNPGGGFV